MFRFASFYLILLPNNSFFGKKGKSKVLRFVTDFNMHTLFNVETRRGEYNPLTSDLPPTSPSEKQNIPTGVSVKYAPDPSKRWFVLRVAYNRVNQANDFFFFLNIDTYLPMHFVWKKIKGKKKRIPEPLLPSFLFAYASQDALDSCMKASPALSYYYDHFKILPGGKNPPLTVAYQEMMNFIRLTSVDNEHICVVNPQQCHYKDGDLVQVIKGDFEGVVGIVARVIGQQRVVIKLDGICLVATAYVPSSFIEKISSSE